MSNQIQDTGFSSNVSLLNAINSADLNGLENLLLNHNKLVEESSTLINNIGTDDESMEKLDNEQKNLEASRSNMIIRKNELMNQKSNILKKEISINGKNIALETWIANHPFEMWNYSNKISKIDVHYSSFGVLAIQIFYKDPNKAIESLGILNKDASSPSVVESVNFTDDEWLMQIQISKSNSTMDTFALCDSISFYTSKNPEGTPPKVTIPASSQNKVTKNKKYFVNGNRLTWLQHKSAAEAQGAELACFENSAEMVEMLAELGNARFQNGGSFYIGLYHPNALIANNNSGGGKPYNVSANKNSAWKWVDGTPYNPNTTNWNGGEPNNWGPGENVAQMYSNGKINDLTKTNRLAAVYQKKIMNTTTQTIRKDKEHIKSFTIKPLSVTYDFITSLDILQKVNAESAVDNTYETMKEIEASAKILDDSIKDVNVAITQITINIEHIKSKKKILIDLNSKGAEFVNNYTEGQNAIDERIKATQIQGFSNLDNNLFSSYMLNMREGFIEGNTTITSTINDAINLSTEESREYTGALLNDLTTLKSRQIDDAIGEFVIKKDNLFSNVLTDYMLNDDKQNTVDDVYEKINQQNTDKMRKIEINTYYNKAYKEYINILQIIIFACAILVPIVIANKNSMLPNTITNILVMSIILFTIVYIIIKFVDIYMRDNIDFDKIKIPYDREATILQREGTIKRKNNVLSSFGVACIGADCCPETSGVLIYDATLNRCVANETFTDYFDKPIGGYLDNTFNNYNSTSVDRFVGGYGQVSLVEPYVPLITKEKLVGASLQNSSPTAMNA